MSWSCSPHLKPCEHYMFCRFRAESQRPPPSGSLSQPSPLNAERSSASLHAESSSTTGFAPSPFQAPYASASPQQHTRPGNDEPAACQHSIFAMQSPVGATGSETHLQTGSPALLDRQEPAQSSAASSDRPGVVQSAAPDTPNTVRLKAKAAQADRLMQVCILVLNAKNPSWIVVTCDGMFACK